MLLCACRFADINNLFWVNCAVRESWLWNMGLCNQGYMHFPLQVSSPTSACSHTSTECTYTEVLHCNNWCEPRSVYHTIAHVHGQLTNPLQPAIFSSRGSNLIYDECQTRNWLYDYRHCSQKDSIHGEHNICMRFNSQTYHQARAEIDLLPTVTGSRQTIKFSWLSRSLALHQHQPMHGHLGFQPPKHAHAHRLICTDVSKGITHTNMSMPGMYFDFVCVNYTCASTSLNNLS